MSLPTSVKAAGGAVEVVEFYNAGIQHYFISADPAQTAVLDGGAPGTKLAIEVWRDGKPVTLAATVGALDDTKVAKADIDAGEPKGKLGVAVRPLSPEEQKAGKTAALLIERQGRQIYVPGKIS
jgi:hypothetical protein